MLAGVQTEVFHLRVGTDVAEILKQQGERCGMSATMFAVQLLRAAALAVENEEGPLIPPRFEFAPQNSTLNEPKPAYKVRK